MQSKCYNRFPSSPLSLPPPLSLYPSILSSLLSSLYPSISLNLFFPSSLIPVETICSRRCCPGGAD